MNGESPATGSGAAASQSALPVAVGNGTIVPILAGGGTRLPAHVGVLTALDQLGAHFSHIVGVSGGSIVASLYAAGRSLDDLKRLAIEIDFTQFRGFSLFNLFYRGGLSSGNRFESWLDQELSSATFSDLQLDFHVVATDVGTGMPVIFDRASTPDFNVARAVRYSMGIPLLFTFGRYGDRLLVDGSILSEDVLFREWGGSGGLNCFFRLRSNPDGVYRPLRKWFPLPDYLIMLIRAFMTTLSREFVSDSRWDTTIVIDTGTIAPSEFMLTQLQKEDLFQRGLQTTLDLLPRKLERYFRHAGISREQLR